MYAAPPGAGQFMVALFQDATANALAAVSDYRTGDGWETPISFTHFMSAGTENTTTFKVRVGGEAAGTTDFNGTGDARLLGGVAASIISVIEIEE